LKRTAGELVLDFTSDAIRLVVRTEDGDAELDAVSLTDPAFRSGVEALRREVSARGDAEITLSLPPDQIVMRRYVLQRGSRDVDKARRRLAADTGRRPETLAVALSPAGDAELVTVLGAPVRTIAEALDYARRWGFRPGRVSTLVEAVRFGPGGASFDPVEPVRRSRFWRLPRLAAAAAILTGLGFAAWGASELLPAPREKPATVELATPASAAAETPGPREPARGTGSRGSRVGPVGDPAGRATEPRVLLAAYARADVPPTAGHLRADRPLHREAASVAPHRRGSSKRPEAPASGADVDLASLDAERPTGDPAPLGEPDIVLAAAGAFAPASVPVRPVPRPTAVVPVERGGEDLRDAATAPSASRLAVAHAPRPPARPAYPKRAQSPPPTMIVAAPPEVRAAAAQRGLSLESTSLIGVIDARDGRRALLRTPSGGYLKVTRGDEVAGWRVNAIGQDAMRLTRGGESRTLLLVTR
jgi:hypothetical protein